MEEILSSLSDRINLVLNNFLPTKLGRGHDESIRSLSTFLHCFQN